MDLERRLNALQGEREGLSSTLDESHDRIVMLEKQTREQDHIVSEPFCNNGDLRDLSIHQGSLHYWAQLLIYAFGEQYFDHHHVIKPVFKVLP